MLLQKWSAVAAKSIRRLFSSLPPPSGSCRVPWHVRRAQCPKLIEYKKNAHKRPLASPFVSIPESTESVAVKQLRAVRRHSLAQPAKKAFIDSADASLSLTFSDVSSIAASVQSFLLTRAAFAPGEVALHVTGSIVEYMPIAIGVWSTGGILSGANGAFTVGELSRQIIDCHCSVIFTEERYLAKVLKASKGQLFVKKIVCICSSSSTSLPTGVSDWREVMQSQPASSQEIVKPEDIALLPYSSGTTGAPKGVMISHRALGTMIEAVIKYAETENVPALGDEDFDISRENITWVLPLYHVYGAVSLCQASFMSLGTTNVLMDLFKPEAYFAMIEKYRPPMLYLAPPIIVLLAKHPLVPEFDLSSFRLVLTGAAPCGQDIVDALLARFPYVKYLGQGYGMSEMTMSITIALFDSEDNSQTCGYPNITNEIRTVNPTTLEDVGSGEQGEIWVRGPCLMTGYHNRPQATAETITPDGWLRSGDIGVIDKDGQLTIVDRLKELIKVKGYQVAPAELEDVLLSHPDIKDSAVIGIPDERMSELVRAYVVRGNRELTKQNVVDFVKNRFVKYKHLTGGVKFVDEIPKSASGKILRKKLRELAKGERSERPKKESQMKENENDGGAPCP